MEDVGIFMDIWSTYFTVIWYIYGHLVYFTAIWYMYFMDIWYSIFCGNLVHVSPNLI
jgi:hypothetical protein